MNPIIDHIQITVKDLKIAENFYDKFLPNIAFEVDDIDKELEKNGFSIGIVKFNALSYFA